MSAALSFIKLPFQFNVTDLRMDVEKINPNEWVDHVNKRDYEGNWKVFPLRCLAAHENEHSVLQGFAVESSSSCSDWCDLPQLKQCATFQSVLATLQCPVKSVRLMCLHAGARILPHRDHGVGIEYGEARLHVPIEINSQLQFIVNDTIVPMSAGELWYINADQTHSVVNMGSQARVNLVIDCKANHWLRDLIAK